MSSPPADHLDQFLSHALPCLFTIKQLAGGSNPWDLANTIVVDCVQ